MALPWICEAARPSTIRASNLCWLLSTRYATQHTTRFAKHQRSCKLTSRPRTRNTPFPTNTSCSMAPLGVQDCISLVQKAVPPLDGVSYKGQAGKIAVIGGSLEYTGAPYFAAISAMRGGAELSFVYCSESAAPPIKAFSPDLIVYPGFNALGDTCQNLDRMHAIVLGPGLGRGEEAATVAHKVILYAIEKKKPLVLDADALWFVSQSEDIRASIRGAPRNFKAFMTPNKIELDRLQIALRVKSDHDIVKWFEGHVVLVQKGPIDRITGAMHSIDVCNSGSLKRVGGQGDILAGLLALCASWVLGHSQPPYAAETELQTVAAAVCACLLTRSAARRAFLEHGRSLLASDIIPHIGTTVDEVFGDPKP